jgi:DNA-binding MarR family transcriptional regulator
MSSEGTLIPDSLNDDLYFNLDRVLLLMRRNILDALYAQQVSPEQWEILQYIDNHEGISQAKLTNLSLKDKGNISRIISRMIRHGWIHRSTEKPKGFIIRLTTLGRQVKDSLPQMRNQHLTRTLRHLSKNEQTDLIYNLKKLRIMMGDDAAVTAAHD